MPNASGNWKLLYYCVCGGLKDEVKHFVKIFEPESLEMACEQALQMQAIMLALSKPSKSFQNPFHNSKFSNTTKKLHLPKLVPQKSD